MAVPTREIRLIRGKTIYFAAMAWFISNLPPMTKILGKWTSPLPLEFFITTYLKRQRRQRRQRSELTKPIDTVEIRRCSKSKLTWHIAFIAKIAEPTGVIVHLYTEKKLIIEVHYRHWTLCTHSPIYHALFL